MFSTMTGRIDDIDEIAERLRRTREALRLNQATWCRMTGIKQQAWNNYERGLNRISIDQAIKVCAATGVSLDWIYRGVSTGLPITLAIALQQPPQPGMQRRR